MTRAARQLNYIAVLIELTGLDRDELAARPPPEQFLIMLKALEERGVTMTDVQGWMALCDPEGTEPPPGKDPVACFRRRATEAMSEPPTLASTVLVWGGLATAAGLVLERALRR